MAIVSELKRQIEELKKRQDFQNLLPLLQELWKIEKNELNGYDLAKCLRKTLHFDEARQFHKHLIENFNSARLQNELLWLDYSEKIKDWQNDNLIADGEELLLKCNMYDKYTGSIYVKTVLSVVKHLDYLSEDAKALVWLDKLDFTVLSNLPFTYGNKKFASDKKAFFVRYSNVLVKLHKHVQFIENCLASLQFNALKQAQFKKYILETITYVDYAGKSDITRQRLALYIKYFLEELNYRKKNSFKSIFNPKKITLISDLADFEFCPVSFAINETFEIPSNVSWEKDEWLGEKKQLIDRYNNYQKTKDYAVTFSDSDIEIDDRLKNDFKDVFESKLIYDNSDEKTSTFYSNSVDSLRGNPDYLFETTIEDKFVVIEKFTRNIPENNSTAFSNDLIKMYGYIFELTDLNLSYGYLIYWYWHLKDVYDGTLNVKKKIQIKSYKIFKIEKIELNKNKLSVIIERVNQFKKSKELSIDGNRISYPNKCLNCSVVSFCNHKTGNFNLVKLPYAIEEIRVNTYPNIRFDASVSEIPPENDFRDEFPNI